MYQALAAVIVLVLAFLWAITIHEFAHALTAYLLGDDTAHRQGRLSLNPLSHIDPLGLLLLLLIRIGWARPVPLNPRNFKYPKFYSVLTGLAGPCSNFLMTLVFIAGGTLLGPGRTPLASLLVNFFEISAYLNVMLGTFNLLPIPPLDGSHVLHAFIPARWERRYYQLQPFALIFLLILLMIPQFQMWLSSTILLVYQFLQQLVQHLIK